MAQTPKASRKFEACKFGTPAYKRFHRWVIRVYDKRANEQKK